MVTTDYAYPIALNRTSASRLPSVNMDNLAFGAIMSDHMFVADCIGGEWKDARVVPYGPLPMSPAISGLHYGQSIFEGMKAFRTLDGQVRAFRPHDHWKRLNKSGARLCMPEIPEELFMAGLTKVLSLDQDWCPPFEKGSLYIRPIYFATDTYIGMRPSADYKLVILTTPVNPYYSHAVRSIATTDFVRAAEKGVGFVKMAGNYARSLLPGKITKEKGYDVVVWLDAKELKYIEEFSTMNAFFVINGKVITPTTERGTILDGITRKSVIQLAEELGYEVEERGISTDELIAASEAGTLQEAFGAGTAATVAPVASITLGERELTIPPVEEWAVAPAVRNRLRAIRSGELPDTHGWMYPIS